MHIFNSKVTTMRKKTPKTYSSAHTILLYLLVTTLLYFTYTSYRQSEVVVTINWKCFEIIVKL